MIIIIIISEAQVTKYYYNHDLELPKKRNQKRKGLALLTTRYTFLGIYVDDYLE